MDIYVIDIINKYMYSLLFQQLPVYRYEWHSEVRSVCVYNVLSYILQFHQKPFIAGQYYTNDQFLNIYSFSMLYKWLYHSQTSTEEASDVASKSAHVFKSLVDKSIDYSFRILDQCERSKK